MGCVKKAGCYYKSAKTMTKVIVMPKMQVYLSQLYLR